MSERIGRLPKRLQGTPVFDRIQSDVLGLRRLVDGYRRRRRPDDEDDLSKDVFDMLDDLDPLVAEIQGVLEVLESRVHPDRADVLEVYREEKRRRAAKEEDPGLRRVRLASQALGRLL